MILSCQNICKSFNDKNILQNISFHIEDQEKAAIVGINGAGKTTLLRIIVGELQADEGNVVLSKNKSLGYLAQNQSVDSNHTIYEELLTVKQDLIDLEQRIRQMELEMKSVSGIALEKLMDSYALLTHQFESGGGYSYRSELAGVLKGLGFLEEEFGKPVCTLSGGQKTRVALGKLLLLSPDLIILDEPTNHLDITSKEILEQALNRYAGTVFFVSHDRYFINKAATRILDLTGETLVNYIGNYDYYLEKCKELTPIYAPGKEAVQKAEEASSNKTEWKQKKEAQARLRKLENDRKRTEGQIEAAEQRVKELEEAFLDSEVATNSAKLQELHQEYQEKQKELESLYEQWEALI